MSGYEERKRGMNAQLAHNSEITFKIKNRRNRLLGEWAADRFGLTGEEAEAYVRSVVLSDFEKPGDDDVAEKVLADFTERGLTLDATTLRSHMGKLLVAAEAKVLQNT